jgi:hypothetical protein
MGVPIEMSDFGNLKAARGMVTTADGRFYLASSKSSNSAILQYSVCTPEGTRNYERDFVSELVTSIGLNHPYGIALDAQENMYVSCQNTNVVLRFDTTGNPIPLPPYFNGSTDFFPGTFAVFNSASNGVRGVGFVGDNLWVASEDDGGVVAYLPTGYSSSFFPFPKAIGVSYDNHTGFVFLSNHDDSARVVALDPSSMSVAHEYAVSGEGHFAGVVVYGDTLFALGQSTNAMYTFNVHTSQMIKKIATFDVTPEQIMLSPC